MKTNSLLLMLSCSLLVLLMGSCKKDGETTATSNEDIATIFANTEATIDDDALFADDNMASGTLLKSLDAVKHPFAPCATITTDTIGPNKTRTIDFGPVNCLCNDGKVRRGKIIISITGRRLTAGSTRTTTYDNYFVNNNQVAGSTSVIYNGLNGSNNPNWTVTVDKTITFSTGQVWQWTATRNREWIAGLATPRDWTDDVYLVTGSGTHSRSDGITRTATIVTPLRREMSCHHFVSGSILITTEGKPDILLDYGNGECDDLATVTVNGVTKTIKI